MTDDQITALAHAIDPFSYIGANTAGVRTSDPGSRQVLDTSATDDIARVLADIDAAENYLFGVIAVAVPIAFALLAITVWN